MDSDGDLFNGLQKMVGEREERHGPYIAKVSGLGFLP
jgi:hypothetical protein